MQDFGNEWGKKLRDSPPDNSYQLRQINEQLESMRFQQDWENMQQSMWRMSH